MDIPTFLASLGVLIFGCLALYFFIQHNKLKNKLSEKEEFTSVLVHELRAPLTAIKTAAEMIVQNKVLSEPQHRLITIIDEQSKRLLNDVNSFLDAAKMDADHFTISQAPSEIVSVIEDSLQLFAAEAEKKQIMLKSAIKYPLPPVFIDIPRVAQVLNNLVSNSLKFTPVGGQIIITVGSQQKSEHPYLPTKPCIVIAVTDTGTGIPKNQQKFLFTKFSSLQRKKNSEPTTSTGLGLYIAKGIIQAHGGTISVDSTSQHGTTISFTLPVAKEEHKVGKEHSKN